MCDSRVEIEPLHTCISIASLCSKRCISEVLLRAALKYAV